MTSFYSAIQFVPDPAADERINIGVVAFDADTVATRFLRDWRRVQLFARGDVQGLREFAAEMSERTIGQRLMDSVVGHDCFDRAALDRALGHWHGTVQFSEPRPALESTEVLLDFAAEVMLWEPKAGRGADLRRHRKDAADIAYTATRLEARQTFMPPIRPEVCRRVNVEGASSFEHRFDVVASRRTDGSPILALHALSFEVEGTESVVKTTAFAVKDVRDKHPELPVGVMALVPKGRNELVARARRAIEEFKGTFLREEDTHDWIRQQLRDAG